MTELVVNVSAEVIALVPMVTVAIEADTGGTAGTTAGNSLGCTLGGSVGVTGALL